MMILGREWRMRYEVGFPDSSMTVVEDIRISDAP